MCDITISCVSVSPADTIACEDLDDANQLVKTFTSADYEAGLAPGVYTFVYEATTYEGVAGVSSQLTFEVELIDPCLDPKITFEQPDDQSVTLTDTQKTYSLSPQITVVPDFCTVTITSSTGSAELDKHLVWDENTQTYTLAQVTDLNLLTSEKLGQTFPVTLTVSVSSPFSTDPPTVDEKTWDLEVKNPCLDTDFVSISSPGLEELDYIVLSGLKDDYPAHADFIVTTSPLVGHSLCGDLRYEARYKGTPVPTTNGAPGGEVLAYDPTTKQFKVETDDETLIETNEPYSLYVRFDEYDTSNPDYATASEIEAEDIIDFNNPCLDPFDFSATVQSVPSTTNYLPGSSVEWEVTKFNIQPDLCKVNYTCTSVTYLGDVVVDGEPVNCDDLTFDGIFNA